MKKVIIILSVILLINCVFLIVVLSQKSSKKPVVQKEKATCDTIAGTKVMEMRKDTFEPQNLTIPRCTKVIFKNIDTVPHWPASNIHPTHGIYPEFDPQKGIDPDDEWSFVFAKKGPWKYHDHLYPQTIGTITVN